MRFGTTPHLTRRRLLVVGLGLAARPLGDGWPVARAQPADGDDWFWEAIDRITARPATGGPSRGTIQNSLFGVEPSRAGRVHPSLQPPKVEDFFLQAELEPSVSDDRGWDVGVIWRIDDEERALWWSIDDRGRWALWRGIWGYSPRDGEELMRGELCESPDAPVLIQAIVVDEMLAIAVNGGSATRVAVPERAKQGQVGIVANLAKNHSRGSGGTPYSGLTLWEIEEADRVSVPEQSDASVVSECGDDGGEA